MPALNYTPYTLPLIAAAGITLWLAISVWRRRPGQGVYSFVALMLATSWWAIWYTLEISAADSNFKSVFAGMQYPGLTTMPVFWLIFLLEYTGREKWLNRRNVLLLMVIPVVTTLFALFNTEHSLIYEARLIVTYDGYTMLETDKGTLFWINAGYAYLLLAGSSILLWRAFIISPQLYKGQIIFMLVGSVAPWVANITYLADVSPFPSLDLTPFAFTVSGLAFAWSMTRYRMLDLVPVARDKVIEGLADAVLVLDSQDRVADVNPTGLALFAHRPEGILGKGINELLPRESSLREALITLREGGTEATLTLPTRGERQFQVSVSQLRRRDGRLTGRIIMLHDITDLKDINRDLAIARAQAIEASRLKSEFLATMSHELRTPLNAIIGYSDLILIGVSGELNELQKDYNQRVLANGERLLALINDILDISKIEAGRLEIAHEEIAIADLVDAVRTRLQSLAQKKGLSLTTAIDPTLPAVITGDTKRLEQILINLIGNAIRFTTTGGIDVRVEPAPPGCYRMVVKDTGVGIPPHALDYIFEEFRQVDGSPERQHGGTGLGLAIVRKLTTVMKGTITVQSEVGVGSTFTVQLPLVAFEMNTLPHSKTLAEEKA